MRASRLIWSAALLLAGALIAPAVFAAELDVSGDQWKATDRSMADLVDDGYELVTVIPSAPHARSYFLKSRRKIAKCDEETSIDVASAQAIIPPPPSRPGDPPPMVMMNDVPTPSLRVNIECAELVRPAPN